MNEKCRKLPRKSGPVLRPAFRGPGGGGRAPGQRDEAGHRLRADDLTLAGIASLEINAALTDADLIAVVPEPGAPALLATLGGVLALRRRRK